MQLYITSNHDCFSTAGCRTPGKDDICADKLENWSRAGAVDARWAYSLPSLTHGASRYKRTGSIFWGFFSAEHMFTYAGHRLLPVMFGMRLRIFIVAVMLKIPTARLARMSRKKRL